jgi:hypothetical protein
MKCIKLDYLSIIKIRPYDNFVYFEGQGCFETVITFKSKHSYEVIITYYYKDFEEKIEVKGKSTSEICIPSDLFKIEIIKKPQDLEIIASSLNDYFDEMLSLN